MFWGGKIAFSWLCPNPSFVTHKLSSGYVSNFDFLSKSLGESVGILSNTVESTKKVPFLLFLPLCGPPKTAHTRTKSSPGDFKRTFTANHAHHRTSPSLNQVCGAQSSCGHAFGRPPNICKMRPNRGKNRPARPSLPPPNRAPRR